MRTRGCSGSVHNTHAAGGVRTWLQVNSGITRQSLLETTTTTMMMMMMMMTMVLQDFTTYAWMLPAPSGVSMHSVDMRHVLRWRPLQDTGNTTVLYSVQFQGEFERLVLNGSWVDAPECQQTPHTHCDLTFDLGSDSDYNLRVRVQGGESQPSPWTQLSRPFNRRDTVLTPPKMAVRAAGDALQVSFDQLPVTAVVKVTVWKKDDELQTVYMMPAEQMLLHVAALQEGVVYCVRAQTVLDTQLHSSSTDPQCVSVTGPDAAWKTPTTVSVTVVVSAGLLLAVFWSLVHFRPDACQTYFHKEPLPRSLKPDIQIPMSPEEAELCERIQVVQS